MNSKNTQSFFKFDQIFRGICIFQKFYSTTDQSQYRLFQELYLKQLIEVLQEVDDWRDFYKQEVAQCYLKLAELCDPEPLKKSDFQFDDKKYDLIEKAAINFNEAGVRILEIYWIFFLQQSMS